MTTVASRTAKIGAKTYLTPLPPEATELVVNDTDLTGFAVRIRPESRRYVLRVRIAGTTIQRKVLIGDAESMTAHQAREEAMRLRNEAKAGRDPIAIREAEREADAAKKAAAVTFAALSDDYIAKWSAGLLARQSRPPRAAAITGHKNDIRRALLRFGSTALDQIDAKTVRAFRNFLEDEATSPSVRRTAWQAFRITLDHALHRGMVDVNPARAYPGFAGSQSRERVLTPDEVCSIWTATADLGRYGQVVQFLVAMPVRVSIAIGLMWEHVDLTTKMIAIPGDMVGNKNGKAVVLPLTDNAVAVLVAQPFREGRVFRGQGGAVVTVAAPQKRRLDEVSGVEGWRLHDLRRTAVSLTADRFEDIDIDAADRWLMHTRAGVEGVYQRSDRVKAMRRIADQWNITLGDAISGAKANADVVQVGGAA